LITAIFLQQKYQSKDSRFW